MGTPHNPRTRDHRLGVILLRLPPTASNYDSIAQNLKEFSLDDHIDKLRVGQNIITIQALNKGKSGSDFLFSCNLLVKRIVKSDNPDFSIDYPLINPTNQNQLHSQFYRVISQ